MTRTYAVVEVSPGAYTEIGGKLRDAGYDHAFHADGGGEVIDMHGLALQTPVVGHVSPAQGGMTHQVEPGSTWTVRLRPDEVRQVAKRVRRQVAAGEHPSLDEVKLLVDALLGG